MAKILIIAPSWVGDMVMTQSLLKILTQHNPQVLLYVAAAKQLIPLLQRMPEIHQTITLNLSHGELGLAKRYKIGWQLRSYQFDQAIIIPNSFKSALIPFFAKIPLRTGFVRELRSCLLNDKRYDIKTKDEPFIHKLSRLALAKNQVNTDIFWPRLLSNTTQQQHALQKFKLQTNIAPILALCPGAAFGPAKCWPAEYYAKVAQSQIAAGWQVWLFGSDNDQKINNEIMRLTNNQCINLNGKTQLAEAVDLIAQVSMVVTNDSGLMHLAAAVDKPILAIYGATNPKIAPPLSNKAKIFYLNLPCQPCGKRQCPLTHLNCLNHLSPDLIINYLLQWTQHESFID
jgi:heptosyltransferase-2